MNKIERSRYFAEIDSRLFRRAQSGTCSHRMHPVCRVEGVENCAERSRRHPFYRSQWAAAASSASRMKKEKIGQNAIGKPDMGENTRWSQSHLI